MADITPNLALPFIMPSQAQKHVTHNEALLGLDALAQLVLSASSSAPPADPQDGSCYWILAPATGTWAGKAGRIAAWQDGAWTFLLPKTGWRAHHLGDSRPKVFDGSDWIDPLLPEAVHVERLGINASPDATNRLTVAAEATLLSHDGAGHQLKINKSTSGDTASLLFQTAWTGRAELGLAGSDDFAIKVPTGGGSWTTALSIGSDGITRMDTRPAVRAARNTIDLIPPEASLSGFDLMTLNRGGFALGSALPSSAGHRLVVPADGLYLIGLQICLLSTAVYGAKIIRNGVDILAGMSDDISTSGGTTRSLLTMANLTAGDWLAVQHHGSGLVGFGPARTEIFSAMI